MTLQYDSAFLSQNLVNETDSTELVSEVVSKVSDAQIEGKNTSKVMGSAAKKS